MTCRRVTHLSSGTDEDRNWELIAECDDIATDCGFHEVVDRGVPDWTLTSEEFAAIHARHVEQAERKDARDV